MDIPDASHKGRQGRNGRLSSWERLMSGLHGESEQGGQSYVYSKRGINSVARRPPVTGTRGLRKKRADDYGIMTYSYSGGVRRAAAGLEFTDD